MVTATEVGMALGSYCTGVPFLAVLAPCHMPHISAMFALWCNFETRFESADRDSV